MTEINRFSNLYQQAAKDGKVTAKEAQVLIKEALSDDVLSQEEATVFYKIGKSLEDTKTFDPSKLKKSDGSTVNQEITDLFKNGMSARAQEKNIENKLSQKATQSTDGILGAIADYTASGLDALGSAIDSDTLKGYAKDLKSYNISEQEQKQINESVGKVDKRATADISEVSFKAFDNTHCVGNSLAEIAKNTKAFDKFPKDAAFVDPDLLEEWTGIEWDEIKPSDYKDNSKLESMMKNIKKGEVLVTDGGHAFVFQGYDAKTGLISAEDRSDKNKIVTFPKDSPALSFLVIGSGDGNKTPRDTRFSMVRTFDYMKKESNKGDIKNSSDVDKTGKANESLEMRELFTFMGDPRQSEQFNALKGLLNDAKKKGFNADSINDIKNFLSAKGINLDLKDVKQMAKTLTTEFNPPRNITLPHLTTDPKNPFKLKVTSPLQMFDWLNDPRKGETNPSTRSNTNTQNRYMRAVQFSNVDLSNYFSSSQDANVKASNMIKVFADMMAGKNGC